MGVSVQAYRIRIGAFNASGKPKTLKAMKVSNSENHVSFKLVTAVLLTACFLLTATQLSHIKDPSNMSDAGFMPNYFKDPSSVSAHGFMPNYFKDPFSVAHGFMPNTEDSYSSQFLSSTGWPASEPWPPPPWPSWSIDVPQPQPSPWSTWTGGTSCTASSSSPTWKHSLPNFKVLTRNECEKCGNDFCCGEKLELCDQTTTSSPKLGLPSSSSPWQWTPSSPSPWHEPWSLAPTSSSSPWSPSIPQHLSTELSTPTSSATFWLSNKNRNRLARAKNGNRQNRGLKLAHWNAGSAHLVNKMHEIEQVVSDNKPHLLGISEANFKRVHDIDDVQLQEYDLVLSKTIDNDQLQVSRVVCYKHQSLVGKVREDLMSDEFSSIWLEIGLPGKRKFLVCQLYREWRYLGQPDRGEHSHSIQEQMRRWVIFLEQWEQALATGKEVIVLGDCNLDFLKFDRAGVLQPLVDSMMQRIYPHGVVQCVQGPTHTWPGQVPSGLDHIYTSVPEKLSQAQVKVCGSSDHKLILATRYSKNIRDNIRYCKKRSYKNFDQNKFLEEVNKISWWDVYSCTDVDMAVDIFTKKLTDILDRMAPVRKFQIRTKYAAWVSVDTKRKMHERDLAQQTASSSGLIEDWDSYRTLRNEVTTQLRKDKLDWQQGKLASCEETSDTGKLWKNILGWLNWSSTSSPTKLLSQGNLESSPSKMANIQNNYYIEKVKIIRRSLQGQDRDPLEVLKNILGGNQATFSTQTITPDQVDKIIAGLKNSKASGMDNLDTYILKLTRKNIVPSVCHILNLSIQSNKFPTKWKIAKVVPLYKGKGSKVDPKNYRPVAILPILSKVLERAMFQQLVTYMDVNKFFNPNHHAYRSFHSTTTAMLQMYTTWLDALEQGEMAGVCMIDMSAAFDVVDTEILLEKLKLYGFDRNAIQWIWSYLTYRSQAVHIEGSLSSLLPLEAGVPQGSILGPIFYTIFTNELPQVVHEASCPLREVEGAAMFTIQCQECGGVCCYADDSTYTATGNDPKELSDKLSHKYAVLADFLTSNKLKVNDDKTHLLVMSTRQKRYHRDTSTITINTPTATITPSVVERLLGAQVHQDMRWKEHIVDSKDALIKSLNKRVGAIKKMSKTTSFKTRKMIANGIFMSKLIYLMPVWMGCEDYLVHALQVCQNKVARLVTKLDRFTSTTVLMRQCGWMPVRHLMVYHSLVLLHKTIQHQTPTFLYQKVTSGSDQPNTRQAAAATAALAAAGVPKQPTVANCELGLKKKSWCWSSVIWYNQLPLDLRLEKKVKTFKTRLKNWVTTNVEN